MTERNDLFRNFINGLEIDLDGSATAEPLPDVRVDISPDVLRFKSEISPNVYEYDIDASMKHFTAHLHNNPNEQYLALSFPSGTRIFNLQDHAGTVQGMLRTVFPKNNQVPWATTESEGEKKNYNLNIFWDGQVLAHELEHNPRLKSVYYSLIGDQMTTPRGPTSDFPSASFRYNFTRTKHETLEQILLTRGSAEKISTELAAKLIDRHAAFSGTPNQYDNDLLVAAIKEVLSRHPNPNQRK